MQEARHPLDVRARCRQHNGQLTQAVEVKRRPRKANNDTFVLISKIIRKEKAAQNWNKAAQKG